MWDYKTHLSSKVQSLYLLYFFTRLLMTPNIQLQMIFSSLVKTDRLYRLFSSKNDGDIIFNFKYKTDDFHVEPSSLQLLTSRPSIMNYKS